MGSQALGVVGLISFLVGSTVALQSAAQLRQFGASLFVADLIGVSITRELGPLMAAIVVAGRSGSAVAAEIGTMVITEEIDALRTMGVHPTRFLVVPKVIAIMITQPLLTVLANALAILGGLFGGGFLPGRRPQCVLGSRLQTALYVKDVGTGIFKSLFFAFLIVTLGALMRHAHQGRRGCRWPQHHRQRGRVHLRHHPGRCGLQHALLLQWLMTVAVGGTIGLPARWWSSTWPRSSTSGRCSAT